MSHVRHSNILSPRICMERKSMQEAHLCKLRKTHAHRRKSIIEIVKQQSAELILIEDPTLSSLCQTMATAFCHLPRYRPCNNRTSLQVMTLAAPHRTTQIEGCRIVAITAT